MTCLIVDDDEMSRTSLELLVQKIDDLEVLATFESGIDALNWLKKNETDLIFLDIEMPDMTGLDLVKTVENLPQIIFTTGHTEHALEAFEYHVTDFLPKPVQYARLLKAVSRAQELNDNVQEQEQDELYVKHNGRFVRISLEELLYVESLGDYVTFVTETKKYIVHSTLKNIDDKITSNKFIKVHRSYIVNLSHVVDIEENNLVIKDKVIPISRAQRPVLMNRIKTL
jgi:DNA-binding LytR/AlgR family response regulator